MKEPKSILTLNLEIKGNLEYFRSKLPNYDLNEVTIDFYFSDLCDILEETRVVYFQVSGFGDSWSVDLLDLTCCLEQLSQTINGIRKGSYPFDLDFYEQGLQRKIIFEKETEDGLIELRCNSRTSWVPIPNIILINKDDILMQLLNLKSSFIQASQTVCPELLVNDLFVRCCQS